jgi:hypothetical protein
METKKSKVKEVRLWSDEPHPKYGYTSTVVFENEDEGRVAHKKNPDPYFVVGQEVEYTIEKIVSGESDYSRIRKPKDEFKGGGKAWQHKGPREYLSEFAGMFTRQALDSLIAEGKEINEENMKGRVHMMYRIVKPLIDRIHEAK